MISKQREAFAKEFEIFIHGLFFFPLVGDGVFSRRKHTDLCTTLIP